MRSPVYWITQTTQRTLSVRLCQCWLKINQAFSAVSAPYFRTGEGNISYSILFAKLSALFNASFLTEVTISLD